ncbi:hypothetical protein BDQ17DRAFT_1371002 [Cyathus striatus]|nr:hypothetical protein BDQ17DRAFT_1371002 [Cyathus striatus]
MAKLTSSQFIHFCIQYSTIALLYYDYCLTFGEKMSNILYVFCRYAMVSNVIYTLAIAGKMHTMRVTLSLLGRTAIIVVWTARTYAVYGKNNLFLHFLAVHLLSIFTVVFELVSALLTTVRAVQAIRAAGPWDMQKDGLMYFLLEQGILYFVFVSGFTTASLVLDFPGTFLQTAMSAYTIPISGLMTARFILHLREWESRHSTRLTTVQTGVSMEFNHDASATVGEFNHNVLSLREFGEDPVQRSTLSWNHEEIGLNTNNEDSNI